MSRKRCAWNYYRNNSLCIHRPREHETEFPSGKWTNYVREIEKVKEIGGLIELDKVRECVGYCFRWQAMSTCRCAGDSFPGTYKAAVIKSHFLLSSNEVAIQNSNNERCAFAYTRGREIARLRDRSSRHGQVWALLIRSLNYMHRCGVGRGRGGRCVFHSRAMQRRALRVIGRFHCGISRNWNLVNGSYCTPDRCRLQINLPIVFEFNWSILFPRVKREIY